MKLFLFRQNWSRVVSAFGILCLFSATLFANFPNETDSANRFQGWHTIGPSGGDVREVVVDPKDQNRVLISTLDGQIYSSNDAGKSWRLIANFNRPQLVLDQLIIDPRDSNIIYTSGHRHKEAGGFYKSKDGGATWKESKDLKDEAIHAMVQSSKNPDILLAGAVSGVWISTNAGDDWKKFTSTTAPVNIDSLAIDPVDTNTLYAGTWWRAYKSTDNGANWKLIKDGMIDDSDVFAIDIDPRDPNHIIASACSGIYDSVNKGEKWKKVNGIPSQSRRTRDIMQHPSVAGTVYAATTEGFWMSKDNGKSWALTTTRQLEINSIAVHPDAPDRVFIGTNNFGVMVSNDGGKTFSQNNGNFSSRLTYSITPDIEQPNRLYSTTINTATGGGFIFVSNDGGQTWNPAMKNITVEILIPYSMLQDKTNPNTIYLATNLGMYRSLDRGNSWSPLYTPAPVKKAPVKGKAVVARKGKAAPKKAPAKTTTAAAATPPTPANPNQVPGLMNKINLLARTEDGKDGYYAGTVGGLYRSYDPVKGWEKLPFGAGLDEQVFALAVSPQDPNTIWVGTALNGVIVSHDAGATWQKAMGIPEAIPVSSIAIDPQRPENIYVGTIQTLYLSRDGGKNWTRRGGNLPLGNYNSILINPRNPNEIFVGSALESNGGIYQSTDAGSNWKRVDGKDEKIPTRRVWAMTFDPNDPNRIFAGTHSAGVYRIERSGSANANEQVTRPRITISGN